MENEIMETEGQELAAVEPENSAGALEQPSQTEAPAAPEPAHETTESPDEPEGQAQDAETRRRFAELRREQELFQRMLGDTLNPTTGKPFASMQEFNGWKESTRRMQEAAQAGVDPELIERLERQAAQRVKETDPELIAQRMLVEQYKAEKQAQMFTRDLEDIRKAYPDEKAKSVGELGEEFLAIMASGKVSALAAYEAVRAAKLRRSPAPPSMGDLGGTAGKEKEFFTRDEVARMSPVDVSKNFEKIRKSQEKWKT